MVISFSLCDHDNVTILYEGHDAHKLSKTTSAPQAKNFGWKGVGKLRSLSFFCHFCVFGTSAVRPYMYPELACFFFFKKHFVIQLETGASIRVEIQGFPRALHSLKIQCKGFSQARYLVTAFEACYLVTIFFNQIG